MTISDTPTSTTQSNLSDVDNSPGTFLSEEDWLCLSFLSGIGPSRLSRLYTYLEQLAAGYSDASPLPLSSSGDLFSDNKGQEFDPELDEEEPTQGDKNSPISYELLRSLKWPEVTAQEAMAYLDHGQLTEEQTQKRDMSLAWLEQENHHVIFQHHPAYPEALKQITVAPTFLYVEGDLDCLSKPKIGIVGARHCTGYGREATMQLAEQLANRGVCVVSGGARGIDTAAHQGALNASRSRKNCSTIASTIAVMGTGLLHRYPKQNKELFESILNQGGALVSEYPLMTEVRAHLFPPRNRIISGLSAGILVAEASPKSGSLISANYAVQQNRDVFALPGRVNDAQAEGCHQLIRQGAVLVRQVEDIFSECPQLTDVMTSTTNRASLVRTKTDVGSMKDQGKGTPQPHDDKHNVSHETPKPLSSVKKIVTTDSSQGSIKNTLTPLPNLLSEDARRIADLLEKETQALDFDALMRNTPLNTQDMMQALMELELSTCIVNYNGRYERC